MIAQNRNKLELQKDEASFITCAPSGRLQFMSATCVSRLKGPFFRRQNSGLIYRFSVGEGGRVVLKGRVGHAGLYVQEQMRAEEEARGGGYSGRGPVTQHSISFPGPGPRRAISFRSRR